MSIFINKHPFIALAMVGILSATVIKTAEIIKVKSIVDQVDVVVIKKNDNANEADNKNENKTIEE